MIFAGALATPAAAGAPEPWLIERRYRRRTRAASLTLVGIPAFGLGVTLAGAAMVLIGAQACGPDWCAGIPLILGGRFVAAAGPLFQLSVNRHAWRKQMHRSGVWGPPTVGPTMVRRDAPGIVMSIPL